MCVVKRRIWVPFWLQVNDMNEKISFIVGVKAAAPFHMGRTFEIYCIEIDAKVPRLNQNNVKINQINMR